MVCLTEIMASLCANIHRKSPTIGHFESMAHTASSSADSFLVVDLITIIGYILGPDGLELTILKITGKISLMIYQKIDSFPK